MTDRAPASTRAGRDDAAPTALPNPDYDTIGPGPQPYPPGQEPKVSAETAGLATATPYEGPYSTETGGGVLGSQTAAATDEPSEPAFDGGVESEPVDSPVDHSDPDVADPPSTPVDALDGPESDDPVPVSAQTPDAS